MAEKLDFRKDLKELYAPSAKAISIVTVPSMHFLMIDGSGDPNNSEQFQNAVEALYNISYTIKFMPKKNAAPPGFVDFSVGPLEGRWWLAEGDPAFAMQADRSLWRWTLMIMQPPFVTADIVTSTVQSLQDKKDNPALAQVRFEDFEEGLSAQILYVGPFSTEETSLQKIYDYVAANGYEITGKHHEIYLGDPRRTAPEKLRTVLRYPVSLTISH